MTLTTVEIKPTQTPCAAIIWLHGLGADGHDFAGMVPELALPNKENIHFIFPNAPIEPVTINQGMKMPSWYDITQIAIERSFSLRDLKKSSNAIQNILYRTIESGIDSRHILLAGFSQGGAVALEAALTFPNPLGGLLCLSTYFATADTIKRNLANQHLSIEVHHGLLDPVVPESLGQHSYKTLRKMEYAVEYRTYQMPHAVCPQQMQDISQFIQQQLFT